MEKKKEKCSDCDPLMKWMEES